MKKNLYLCQRQCWRPVDSVERYYTVILRLVWAHMPRGYSGDNRPHKTYTHKDLFFFYLYFNKPVCYNCIRVLFHWSKSALSDTSSVSTTMPHFWIFFLFFCYGIVRAPRYSCLSDLACFSEKIRPNHQTLVRVNCVVLFTWRAWIRPWQGQVL